MIFSIRFHETGITIKSAILHFTIVETNIVHFSSSVKKRVVKEDPVCKFSKIAKKVAKTGNISKVGITHKTAGAELGFALEYSSLKA